MVFRLYWKQAGDRQNMIIRQLNIKNSGEIHDKTLEFSPGINVLYGENENERTTIHTYIKSMFFKDKKKHLIQIKFIFCLQNMVC